MIVGPMKVLFMDEISTGLDSSTTFSIVRSLRRYKHEMSASVMISLLQPAPESFNLFDDVLLLSEGQVVYHGPIAHVTEFFELCGFKSPERKGIADFLQEVPNLDHPFSITHSRSPISLPHSQFCALIAELNI
jgi:ABC-type multidrug transport system ATPase subunit